MSYLYIYANPVRRQVYVGIGLRTSRIFESHNSAAEELLEDPETELLQTPVPFGSREDARQAEAAAIYVAHLMGAQVLSDLDGDAGEPVTNRAGVLSTGHLVPSVMRRDGTVTFEELRRTAVVVLSMDSIDERGTLHAGRRAATFAERAEKWWGLGAAIDRGARPRRLLAVMRGSAVVLGQWHLCEDRPMERSEQGGVFLLADPEEDDAEGLKGRTLLWQGNGPGGSLKWSLDLRA